MSEKPALQAGKDLVKLVGRRENRNPPVLLGARSQSILLRAVEQHPEVAVVHYNLACYECQLGNMELAKGHLEMSFKIEKGLKLEALDETDLEPLGDVAD